MDAKAHSAVIHLRDLTENILGPLQMRALPIPEDIFKTSLLHEALPPYSKVPQTIIHDRTHEFVFICKGRATVYLDGTPMPLASGDSLHIPAKTAHYFKTEEEGVEALSFFSPPLDPKNPDARLVDI